MHKKMQKNYEHVDQNGDQEHKEALKMPIQVTYISLPRPTGWCREREPTFIEAALFSQ